MARKLDLRLCVAAFATLILVICVVVGTRYELRVWTSGAEGVLVDWSSGRERDDGVEDAARVGFLQVVLAMQEVPEVDQFGFRRYGVSETNVHLEAEPCRPKLTLERHSHALVLRVFLDPLGTDRFHTEDDPIVVDRGDADVPKNVGNPREIRSRAGRDPS